MNEIFTADKDKGAYEVKGNTLYVYYADYVKSAAINNTPVDGLARIVLSEMVGKCKSNPPKPL